MCWTRKKLSTPIAYQDHAVDVLAQVATYVGTGRLFALIASVDIKGGSARDVVRRDRHLLASASSHAFLGNSDGNGYTGCYPYLRWGDCQKRNEAAVHASTKKHSRPDADARGQ